MFSNFSSTFDNEPVDYPIKDNSLPFAEYIARTRKIIETRRLDLDEETVDRNKIIATNCPFELIPTTPLRSGERYKHGALLIHGLLDCPFSMLDIGKRLQANGVFCHSVLLPGQGTRPTDLLKVSYEEWIQTVRYGVESMANQVDQLHLVGYSTGATLSLLHALNDKRIKNVTLLSPAIRIKAPVDVLIGWHYFLKQAKKNGVEWAYQDIENDYAKYKSVPLNGIRQVAKLTQMLKKAKANYSNLPPILIVISQKDETVSCSSALKFFSSITNPTNELLLYSSAKHPLEDKRIEVRPTYYKDFHINHMSHIAVPFSPDNTHYGHEGDYTKAMRIDGAENIYGAYNPLIERFSKFLHNKGTVKQVHKSLTYNPDFEFMANKIVKFVVGS